MGGDGDPVGTVCLVVPSGDWQLEPLVASLRRHNPEVIIVAIWCGDPHRRPTLEAGVRWADLGLESPVDVAWNTLLVAMPDRAFEWTRTAVVVSRLLDDGAGSVVVLRVGSVMALGPIPMVTRSGPQLVRMASDVLPCDGLGPGEADLVRRGHHSTNIALFGEGSQGALRWLSTRLIEADVEVGPWLDRLGELFEVSTWNDPGVLVGGWGQSMGVGPALLDTGDLSVDEPWHFTFGPAPARIRLSGDPVLSAAVATGADQLIGVAVPPALPGGIVVDEPLRRLVRGRLEIAMMGQGALPPEPYGGRNSEFLAWLEDADPWDAEVGRYWMAVRDARADLRTIFPQPDAADLGRFREWIDASWRLEGQTSLLRSFGTRRQTIESGERNPNGVNVLGYLDFDQSQGHVARLIVSSLQAAGVNVRPLNFHRSRSSKRADEAARVQRAEFATNVIVVNADQFGFVVADHGASLLRDRHTIAFWFWELEHVPRALAKAADHVDEIWVGSTFVRDAFARVTDRPVSRVQLPVAEPQPSARGRDSWSLPEDRFIFLVTFDQFSVPERKNPFGAIDAFTRGFRQDEGPMLVIKTMNGAKGWCNHERLLLAAAGRSDIVVWDEHLSRADQMAVVNAADCLVSLHRSEGLGLHCAEAMWLGKPVIATRYSGNLDFMDDTCSALIDYELIPVRHGDGIYPPEARWADPDLDQAAEWMRRLASDHALVADLGRRARLRMERQPSPADVGKLMARLAKLSPPEGHTSWD